MSDPTNTQAPTPEQRHASPDRPDQPMGNQSARPDRDRGKDKAAENHPARGEGGKSHRLARREARLKAIREAQTPRRVRLTPKDDNTRQVLRHPRYGAFPSSGSVEWPLDQFTKRRIRDGSVTAEERGEAKTSAQKADAMRAARASSTPRT